MSKQKAKEAHDRAKLERLNREYCFDNGNPEDPERFDFSGDNAQFLELWASMQPPGTKNRLVYQYRRVAKGNVDGFFIKELYIQQDFLCYLCQNNSR